MNFKKYRFLLGVSLLLGFSSAFAQTVDPNKETARQLLEMAEEINKSTAVKTQARDIYVQVVDFDPENQRALFMAGKLYLETVNKERAVKYLKKLYELNPEYRFDIPFMIGEAYQYAMDFDNALLYYRKYKSKYESKVNYRGQDLVPMDWVDRKIYECENGKKFMVNPSHWTIVNLGENINSDSYDFAPVFNEDETLIIFTSRRQDGNLNENVDKDNFYFEDIYYSRKVNGQWEPAKNIGTNVNTRFHDSNLALSADGQTLFIYRDSNGGDIYYSTYNETEDDWSEPLPVEGRVNTSFSENSISISPDGNTLFFSSDRPGGMGELDIYMATKDDKGVWSKVKNLGETINTPYDDDSPFIDYDGKTLYFSSKGRDGMGGFDIFKTVYDSAASEWSEPVNLGYPINTPDNDIYFVSTADGKRGYYSSVREDGMGYTDIYMVKIPDEFDEQQQLLAGKDIEKAEDAAAPDVMLTSAETEEVVAVIQPVILEVKIVDQGSKAAMESRVNVREANTGMSWRGVRQENGAYRFELKPTETSNFTLSSEKDGYVFKNLKLKLPVANDEEQMVERTLAMSRIQTGQKSILRNVYFDFGSAKLKKESFSELNKLERMLSENPSIKVEISGHTDAVGSAGNNMKLSQKRAEAVMNYLEGKGVDATRITAVGYGEERPLASNDDEEEGRELNRRVEFEIIEK
ncbi:OmpA family protein [Persicobacter sp. CCB-QB2]|uniref:OmpA family protein n=1 Tax=Persicobacter sp. CCB-QB2 TaxID=1561025 RepID=UPI0006A948AA|nr:OmpA family protein [Persicobacter sp. CCB-QB2]